MFPSSGPPTWGTPGSATYNPGPHPGAGYCKFNEYGKFIFIWQQWEGLHQIAFSQFFSCPSSLGGINVAQIFQRWRGVVTVTHFHAHEVKHLILIFYLLYQWGCIHVVIRTANEVSSFEEDLFWVECSRIFRKREKSQMIHEGMRITQGGSELQVKREWF